MLWMLAICIGFPVTAATFVGDRTDFRDETIYFAMTTRFYDGDPKNNVCSWDKQDVQISKNDPDWRGDFAGLIEKLDYIKALGFTAIWITPVVQNASGEDYHGYHAMDMSSVDLRYESRTEWGSEKDVKFQDLIDAAHAKGMKIVLDVVLQHTGNFGEVNLNPLFERDQNIRNQASVSASLIVNTDRLSSNYFDQTGTAQYQERWKYFKNPQYEPNNYYHHYGTGWNWDYPNRWWGQIAGDCVDLNTENDYVAEYVVNCYGEFIKMGVDGFRIDTTGHISPLTFNKQFIPQFHAIAEQYKHKRLNECPFFMFGECCQRFQGSVVYRNQANLSSYFYTWKSDQSLLDAFDGDPEWWRQQVLPEGHDTPVGPMAVCEQDSQDKPRSNNAWMLNGAWHEPDYSQSSGLNVIDFPVHYGFNSVGSIMGLFNQDNYYNDATYNVVYVDSHDYCPGPNDGTRFNGGTEQWAENLSWMFTFRGIPCIYYGSEVEFKKGLPIDVGGENNKTPRSQSGRAYFGNYLEGSVTAFDFGEYTASGNVDQTLNGDLAQHVRRLNQIRAAVPALRKGQYTFDDCQANGGWAFKRAWEDSYALVAVNGGATFTNVPAGTYVDIVTGQTYNVTGSVTVEAPHNKGQLRVLVKGWTGGKVGEDGKFMYTSSPVAHGGSVEFDDPGTPEYYTSEDAVARPSVTLSPAGGLFKTETLTVTASLNESATTGWYKIGSDAQVSLTPGQTKTFIIGGSMNYGETVTVTWGANGIDGKQYTGTATYKKVDPNAVINVYVNAPSGSNIYAWSTASGSNIKFCGEWPGKSIDSYESVDVNGETYHVISFADTESVNVIFNKGGNQTPDIKNITEDVYYIYDGAATATKVDGGITEPQPKVTFSPNGGNFTESVNVTATAVNSTSAWYCINNGSHVAIDGTASFTLGDDYSYDTPITVSWSATNSEGTTKTGNVTFTRKQQGVEPENVIYLRNTSSWTTPAVWAWTEDANCTAKGTWPGDVMINDGDLWKWVLPEGKPKPQFIIFSNNGSSQTGNLTYVAGAIYDCSGNIEGGDIPEPGEGFWVYFDNSASNWSPVNVHYWGGSSSTGWPGVAMTLVEGSIYGYKVPSGTTGLVFNGGNDTIKTGDFVAEANGLYDKNGKKGSYSGIDGIESDDANAEVIFYNLQGIRVDNPANGYYIRRQGSKVDKVYVK